MVAAVKHRRVGAHVGALPRSLVSQREGFGPAAAHPPGLKTRVVEAGLRMSSLAGRRGRGTSSPPQFGHLRARRPSAHATQNVHSKEQILASADSGARSMSQHSQLGLSSSMCDLRGVCCNSKINGSYPTLNSLPACGRHLPRGPRHVTQAEHALYTRRHGGFQEFPRRRRVRTDECTP
jgi:hypothetical protein